MPQVMSKAIHIKTNIKRNPISTQATFNCAACHCRQVSIGPNGQTDVSCSTQFGPQYTGAANRAATIAWASQECHSQLVQSHPQTPNHTHTHTHQSTIIHTHKQTHMHTYSSTQTLCVTSVKTTIYATNTYCITTIVYV